MKYRINFNLFLFILLIGIIIFSLFYGAVRVPVSDVIKIILNKTGLFNYEISKQSYIPIDFQELWLLLLLEGLWHCVAAQCKAF